MSNWVLNFGLVFETCCAAFLLYFPYSYVLGFYPLAPEWWLPALPYTLLIFLGDEVSSCPTSCPSLALRSAATS
jgi:sodium/potassium-transporting ATPase subunit alpha